MPNVFNASSLDDVINKSIDDATAEEVAPETPQEPVEDEGTEDEGQDTEDTSEDDSEGAESDSEGSDDDSETDDEDSEQYTAQVESPAATTKPKEAKTKDDFESEHGVKAKTKNGKENRIPYSRVKKIVANAEAAVRSKFDTELTSYKEKADRFEQIDNFITTRPDDFMQVLSGIPAYKPFFDGLKEVLDAVETGQVAKPTGKEGAAPVVAPDDDMPAPNATAADGSKVYDEVGLRNLLEWNANKVEKRVTERLTTDISKRYEPLEEEYKRYAQVQQIMPEVKRKAAEARTWPHFVDNEAEIVTVLQSNPGIGLEAAYRQVVIPKIQEGATVSKDQMRQTLLKELKKSPRSTSAPANRSSSQKEAPAPGSRDLTAVINEAIDQSGIK